MTDTIAELLDDLQPDEWRLRTGFTPELRQASERMYEAHSDDEIALALREWLQHYQPCLFGRVAARAHMLSYCILREHDLRQSDDHIAAKVQASRLDWLRAAEGGNQSGFVILALSKRLAESEPNARCRQLAQRLCELYLLEPIETDTIYVESVSIQIPGQHPRRYIFDAGVNVFSAQADGRWWQDHRIPGGLAFSINSVGHLVRSIRARKAAIAFEQIMGDLTDDERTLALDSLDRALEIAMRTIERASDAPSGKATKLIPISAHPAQPNLSCPVRLPSTLAVFNPCEYAGHYHTDHTIPSIYFTPSVERPLGAPDYRLDFTYLFDSRLDNFDYVRLGTGRRVSAAELAVGQEERALKRRRASPRADISAGDEEAAVREGS